MDDILVPTSPGELIDKLTILRLKSERIADPAKRANVAVEREALERIATRHLPRTEALAELWDELYGINGELWRIEDEIRDCDRAGDFGDGFVRLARAVYITNDRRAAVKKRINLLLGSALVEEKSYSDHDGSAT